MTSFLDELPTPNGEGEDAPGGHDRPPATYSDEFVAEIRDLLTPPAPLPEVDSDSDAAPALIFPEPIAQPAEPEAAPVIRLFAARPEPEERPAPSLAGLKSPAVDEGQEPAAAPNLFISSAATPVEVSFVPAEEVGSNRNRWLLIVIGLFAVMAALWLTWLAQSGDPAEAPVTTVDLVTTTEAPTPSTTVESTTATTAPRTTATTATTTATSVATTEAPVVTPAPTTPRRPATTARPRTTAAPTTTEAPTIPDVSFSAPTVAPNTTPTTPPTPPPEDPPAEG